MKVHVEIVVSGFVQGVGYRYFCYKQARMYGLVGYVKNMASGQVSCVAEGEEGLIHDFIRELRRGPSFSDVRDLEVERSECLQDYSNFEIKY